MPDVAFNASPKPVDGGAQAFAVPVPVAAGIRKLTTMRSALADPQLLGNALPGDSWALWRVLLVAAMGEPLLPQELELFRSVTGRDVSPTEPISEAAFVVGRRGGKDRACSVLSAYLSCLCDWRHVLAAGETGTLLCLGADQRQARAQRNYIQGAIESSPLLRSQITGSTADTIDLIGNLVIEVRAANFRRIRGLTAIAIIATESAFWISDEHSANPDTEIAAAGRPALATTGGPFIFITSPYARRGEVYDIYRRNFGPTGDLKVLVAQGASRTFNPTLPQSLIDRAMERDPASAKAEYLGQFRDDLEAYVTAEAIDAVTSRLIFERPPRPGISFHAFCDPSGGASDSMTLGIAHLEGETAVLDCLREQRPPFSPAQVVSEFALLLKGYGIRRVYGDRWGGEFVREPFRTHGIEYRLSEKTKSDLYRDFLPAINSRRVDLLDSDRLKNQLCNLERRVGRSGRDSIDHGPNGHDDLGNVCAGVIDLALSQKSIPRAAFGRFELVR